jgi:hypothetical protein
MPINSQKTISGIEKTKNKNSFVSLKELSLLVDSHLFSLFLSYFLSLSQKKKYRKPNIG